MLQASLPDILAQVPDYMHDRASRYKSKRSAFNYLQGRSLMSQGLQHLGKQTDLSQMSYLPNGKPILTDIAFNISHSQRLAVCALSSIGEIGIDVECKKQLHLPHLKQNFTESEWEAIQTDPSYPDLFYKLWCRKESIIKASGKTLAELHKLHLDPLISHVQFDAQDWHLTDLSFTEDCYGALCTKHPVDSIEYISCLSLIHI